MSASSFYIDRKPRLLHEYDSFARYVRPALARNFNPGDVDALVAETRQEYDRLIPQLPYIGGKRPLHSLHHLHRLMAGHLPHRLRPRQIGG